MGMFTFSVINGKHLFWVNSVEIFKFVNLTRNSVLRLIQIRRVQWICSLLLFWTGNTVLGKFGPNIQICQFKLKFGAQTNSNMQNWMEMFPTCVSNGKHFFWANSVEIFKFVNLTWNLVLILIQICRTEWRMFTFSIINGNHLFWANLVQKIKILNLSWNLVLRLIQIWRIQWGCSLFLRLTGNTFFG